MILLFIDYKKAWDEQIAYPAIVVTHYLRCLLSESQNVGCHAYA